MPVKKKKNTYQKTRIHLEKKHIRFIGIGVVVAIFLIIYLTGPRFFRPCPGLYLSSFSRSSRRCRNSRTRMTFPKRVVPKITARTTPMAMARYKLTLNISTMMGTTNRTITTARQPVMKSLGPNWSKSLAMLIAPWA